MLQPYPNANDVIVTSVAPIGPVHRDNGKALLLHAPQTHQSLIRALDASNLDCLTHFQLNKVVILALWELLLPLMEVTLQTSHTILESCATGTSIPWNKKLSTHHSRRPPDLPVHYQPIHLHLPG